MKISTPMIKPIRGIPKDTDELIDNMTYEELVAFCGFNPAQTELVATLTDEQLQGIIDGTPEGKELEAQIDALE